MLLEETKKEIQIPQRLKDIINEEFAQAVRIEDLDGIKSAILAGANINYSSLLSKTTVLMTAVGCGYLDVEKFLKLVLIKTLNL